MSTLRCGYSAGQELTAGQHQAQVEALDAMARLPAIRRLKAWTVDCMAPQPGMRALDVGCGTGEDVRDLAARVVPAGLAVGVDAAEAMVTEARRRATRVGSSARFAVGSADCLPFPGGTFDRVRAERLLQHVANPADCVSEMARVLRPGGVVALIDTDWRSLTVRPGPPALIEAVRDSWCEVFANADAGAQLPTLLLEAGLTDPVVTADQVILKPREVDATPVTQMAHQAVRSGALSRSDAAAWLHELRSAAARGDFMLTVTMAAAMAGSR